MYISPNFQVDNDPHSYILSPLLEDDGSDNGKMDSYLFVAQLGAGKVPIALTEKINRDKVLLAKVDASRSMWLYPSGKIKIEV
jgi:hypothetical protein